MKKIFFISSLVLLTAWIVCVFVLKAAGLVHVLLVLSMIVYIRSLICTDTPPAFYNNNNNK